MYAHLLLPPVHANIGVHRFSLWDLDNCLADDQWRVTTIDWSRVNPDERYARYHDLCDQDEPANLATFYAVTQYSKPVFLTARPRDVREKTRKWIAANLGINPEDPMDPLLLFMRRSGEHLPSAMVKERMLKEFVMGAELSASLVAGNGDSAQLQRPLIVGAFDDREDVIRMYRQYQVPAAILRVHDVCTTTPPNGVSL